MAEKRSITPSERIERCILLIRGEKAILDSGIAASYGVETKALVRATKRNIERFPRDFMFQPTAGQFADLRRQAGTSRLGFQSGTSSWGGRRGHSTSSMPRPTGAGRHCTSSRTTWPSLPAAGVSER